MYNSPVPAATLTSPICVIESQCAASDESGVMMPQTTPDQSTSPPEEPCESPTGTGSILSPSESANPTSSPTLESTNHHPAFRCNAESLTVPVDTPSQQVTPNPSIAANPPIDSFNQPINSNPGNREHYIHALVSEISKSLEFSGALGGDGSDASETVLKNLASAAGLEINSLLNLAKTSNDALYDYFVKNPEHCHTVLEKFLSPAANAKKLSHDATPVPPSADNISCNIAGDVAATKVEPVSIVPPATHANEKPPFEAAAFEKGEHVSSSPELSSSKFQECPSSHSQTALHRENVMIAEKKIGEAEPQMSAPVETVVENLKSITNPITSGICDIESVRSVLVPWAQSNKGNRTFAEKTQMLNLVLASSKDIQVAVLDTRVLSVMCNWLLQALTIEDNFTLGCIMKAFAILPIAVRHIQVNKRFLFRVVKSISAKTADSKIKSQAQDTLQSWTALEQNAELYSPSESNIAPSSTSSGPVVSGLPPPKLNKERITNRRQVDIPIDLILPLAKSETPAPKRPARPYELATAEAALKTRNDAKIVESTNNVNSETILKEDPDIEILGPGVVKKTVRAPGLTGILKKVSTISKPTWSSSLNSMPSTSKRNVRWRDTLDDGQLIETKFFCSLETPSGLVPVSQRKEVTSHMDNDVIMESENFPAHMYPIGTPMEGVVRGGSAMDRSEGLTFRQCMQSATQYGNDKNEPSVPVSMDIDIPASQHAVGSSIFPWSKPKEYGFVCPRGVGTRAISRFSPSTAFPFAILTTPIPPTPRSPNPYYNSTEPEISSISIQIKEGGVDEPVNKSRGGGISGVLANISESVVPNFWNTFISNQAIGSWHQHTAAQNELPIFGTVLPGALPTMPLVTAGDKGSPFQTNNGDNNLFNSARNADAAMPDRKSPGHQPHFKKFRKQRNNIAENGNGQARAGAWNHAHFQNNSNNSNGHGRGWGAATAAAPAPQVFRGWHNAGRGARGGPYFGGRGRRRAGPKFSRGEF